MKLTELSWICYGESKSHKLLYIELILFDNMRDCHEVRYCVQALGNLNVNLYKMDPTDIVNLARFKLIDFYNVILRQVVFEISSLE